MVYLNLAPFERHGRGTRAHESGDDLHPGAKDFVEEDRWIDVVERCADAPAKVSLVFRSSMVFMPVACQLTSTRPKSLIRPRKRNWAGLNFTALG